VPYGDRSGEWIRERTFQCLEWLFAQWCVLVIMACNTASAFALREWQELYPDRKVLSVTVPGVEALVAWDFHRPLLLATKVTIETHIYELVRQRAFPTYEVERYVQIWHWRVDALESWLGQEQLTALIEKDTLERFLWKIDCIVLWCTHYPLIKSLIEKILPRLPIVDPWYESAVKLQDYLYVHQDIDKLLSKTWKIDVFVTGDTSYFDGLITTLRWIQERSQQCVVQWLEATS
jgi:glutamate racemase